MTLDSFLLDNSIEVDLNDPVDVLRVARLYAAKAVETAAQLVALGERADNLARSMEEVFRHDRSPRE